MYGENWQSKIAKDLNTPRQVVSKWKKRGSLPKEFIPPLLTILHDHGIACLNACAELRKKHYDQ